ncbi:MAG TPA: hypothetical protein PKI11_19690 [Candidatus Hydrogenedentes bacterium]|nr:hypothetical protein [Candidatus Hydrogenedentota bacterium]HNT87836.1 hypothetical protein [Candidatus Hydrogenedentota bacterium]
MKEALRRQVIIGKGGHIEIPPVDLPEGTEAELVLLVHLAGEYKRTSSIMDMRGLLRGTYGTAREADAYLRAERDSWED